MNQSYSNDFGRDDRRPLTAAMLSVVPGLGQLYVGERRKGILFLEAGALNFVLLWLLCCSGQIINTLQQFSNQYRFELNTELMAALNEFHLGSPASIFLLALILLFMAYAASDAYDHAFGLKRKKIYGDSILEMSEATSGSYVGHIALMLTCLLMAALFVHAPKQNIVKSIVEYEFNDSKPEVPMIKPPRVSDTAHRNHGIKRTNTVNTPTAHRSQPTENRRDGAPAPSVKADSQPARQKVSLPSTPDAAAAPPVQPTPHTKSTPQLIQNPSPLALAPHLEAVSRPAPHAVVAPSPAPLPTLVPQRSALIASAPPMPSVGPVPVSALGQMPLPLPTVRSTNGVLAASGIPGVKPISFASSSSTGTLGAPKAIAFGTGYAPSGAPAPANIPASGHGTGTNNGAPTSLAQVKTGGTHGAHGGPSGHGSSSAPSPIKFAVGGPGDGPGGYLAVVPSGAPRSGTSGNTETPTGSGSNDDGRTGGPATTKEVDFSRYMADLQRRIKKQWFPPKDSESKRIAVTFKIARDGNMSNLRLFRGSGSSLADQAALNAVQNASPFPSLPAGAPESVDIEFTFDFNVFR